MNKHTALRMNSSRLAMMARVFAVGLLLVGPGPTRLPSRHDQCAVTPQDPRASGHETEPRAASS